MAVSIKLEDIDIVLNSSFFDSDNEGNVSGIAILSDDEGNHTIVMDKKDQEQAKSNKDEKSRLVENKIEEECETIIYEEYQYEIEENRIFVIDLKEVIHDYDVSTPGRCQIFFYCRPLID